MTVSEVFRGTDNRQSVLGSWEPSAAREGRPKGDIMPTLLTSEVIKGRVANGAVTWGGTAWNTKLSSLGFVLNSTGFKSGLQWRIQGGGHGAMSTPFRTTINIFGMQQLQHMANKISGLAACGSC